MKADQVRIVGAPLAPEKSELAGLMTRLNTRYGGLESGGMDCEPDLWIDFFFDGTDNKLEIDRKEFAHTNVARIYRSHIEDDEIDHIYRRYFPGVGAQYRDELTGAEDKGGNLGKGFGAGGIMRLQCAMEHLKDRIRAAEAKTPSKKIRRINMAIFGFSRGAALARAFALMLEKETFPFTLNEVGNPVFDDGPPVWRGAHPHPFRIYFMGLFDTVASVDTPTSMRNQKAAAWLAGGVIGVWSAATADGHGSWARDLRIPSRRLVERCVHLVAAHEVRLSFPVDLVLDDGILPSNCEEILFPGVHSDVGGGYHPGEQGRDDPASDQFKLSQIALHYMFREAWKAGVPLRNPAKTPASGKVPKGIQWGGEQTRDFALSPELVARTNHYLQSLSLAPGGQSTLQGWIEAHMGPYFRWRATILDQPFPQDHSKRPEEKKQKDREETPKLHADFQEDAKAAHSEHLKGKCNDKPYRRLLAQAYEVRMRHHAQLCEASLAAPPDPEVCRFFQKQVHDSAVAFRAKFLDGTRLSYPRISYVGGDKRTLISMQEHLTPEITVA